MAGYIIIKYSLGKNALHIYQRNAGSLCSSKSTKTVFQLLLYWDQLGYRVINHSAGTVRAKAEIYAANTRDNTTTTPTLTKVFQTVFSSICSTAEQLPFAILVCCSKGTLFTHLMEFFH